MKETPSFRAAMAQLNHDQREAVMTIDGPVLVVAGPGTGKTEILAARVGNILLKTDTAPENILCLSFTTTAALNMRKRLLELIGVEAYKVKVTNFHSFCNGVLYDHPEEFGDALELSLLSELDKNELLVELLAELEASDPLFTTGEPNKYLIRDILGLFKIIKQENWDIQSTITKYQTKLAETEKMFEMSVSKKDLEKTIRKLRQSISALRLYNPYQEIARVRGLYDYYDMLLWVIKKFQEDEGLLATYQEQYHYLLVDEAQDSNGAQNSLLHLLTQYWEDPNLFLVGDDDQSIYKFQGASPNNIIDFIDRYDPKVIVLEKNYRSSQKIVETAQVLVRNNKNRVSNYRKDITKNVVAANEKYKNLDVPVSILTFDNEIQESNKIYKNLVAQFKKGKDLSTVGVLYRSHGVALRLKDALIKEGVPIQESRAIDALSTRFFQKIEQILEYLRLESQNPFSGDHLLFEILHFDFFKIAALDIAKLSEIYNPREHKLGYREMIASPDLLANLNLISLEAISQFSAGIEALIKGVYNQTLQQFFEDVLNRLGILDYALGHRDQRLLLDILKSVFDFLKSGTELQADFSIRDFLYRLSRLRKYQLKIPLIHSMGNDKGVHFTTVHGAKGEEYETVFLMGAIPYHWEKGNKTARFIIILDKDEEDPYDKIEEERRIFYVAMTRAKSHLFISSVKKIYNKDSAELNFITEIASSSNVIRKRLPSIDPVPYLEQLFVKKDIPAPKIDLDLVKNFMKNYSVNITGLNKYLKCHNQFYFENILRIPSSTDSNRGFGNAFHDAMRSFIVSYEESQLIDEKVLVLLFKNFLAKYRNHFTLKEYEKAISWGDTELKEYYLARKKDYSKPKKFKTEYKISDTHISGIPVNGILDRIDIYKTHVEVVDYKTGNPDKSSLDSLLRAKKRINMTGGDYWRQMVFYKMLLEVDTQNNFYMQSGYFDFSVRSHKSNSFIKRHLEISPQEVDAVKEQLHLHYKNLQLGIFDKACKTCRWCAFLLNQDG